MDQNRVENQVDEGTLQIHLTNASTGIPVKGAKISISYTGGPQQVLEEVDTDDSGNTEKITLDAPPLEYSMEPGENQPYAEYTIKVQATGYRDITVSAINILSGEDATQEVVMEAQDAPGNPIDTIVIDAHTLYGEYPPKIPESEIKTVEETGEIVLSRVVIPEYVVVHDGAPGDSTAPNYYVRYRDYIKNVASSEIYATWPDATIRANVLAIMSFTLNRVYTEWYRGKGYVFTITSSTAYDHKFIYGRNFFQSISQVVDEMFENYLSRPNVRQPILTQYCDGQRVTCPDWMSQWEANIWVIRDILPLIFCAVITEMICILIRQREFPEFRHPGRDMIWAWEQADQRYVSCRNSWQEFRVLIRRYRRLRRTEFTDQGRGKRWKSFSRFSDFR